MSEKFVEKVIDVLRIIDFVSDQHKQLLRLLLLPLGNSLVVVLGQELLYRSLLLQEFLTLLVDQEIEVCLRKLVVPRQIILGLDLRGVLCLLVQQECALDLLVALLTYLEELTLLLSISKLGSYSITQFIQNRLADEFECRMLFTKELTQKLAPLYELLFRFKCLLLQFGSLLIFLDFQLPRELLVLPEPEIVRLLLLRYGGIDRHLSQEAIELLLLDALVPQLGLSLLDQKVIGECLC